MRAIIKQSNINGIIDAPASKSSMQRVLAAALLRKGITCIHHPGKSDDDKAALSIIRQLGASADFKNNILEINSPGFPNENLPATVQLNFGESGLAARMFTSVAALSSSEIIITGEGSLLNRPMNFFEEVLPELGVSVNMKEGKLPAKIRGPLIPKNISVDGSRSSQFLTGLLLAFAVSVKEETIIAVNNLKSKPYIDLTLGVLKEFGYKIKHENYLRFYIEPSTVKQPDHSMPQPFNYFTESDWSNSAFLLVAGAAAGSVTLKGLSIDSSQGDKIIIDVLKSCGANLLIENDVITVSKSLLRNFEFDATDCPDLFPPLVALAACCNGKSAIKGISRLADKESDRSAALKAIFRRMGISITLEDDKMIIEGGIVSNARIGSFNDHRIVMAAAVAGLSADEIIIDDAEAVNKSYPDFFNDLQKLGAIIDLKNN